MTIAICDDDERDLNSMFTLLKEYFPTKNIPIYRFLTAQDLYNSYINGNNYDIVILDIEMPKPSGYDIAIELKKNENSPLIIFATCSMKYAIKGYGIAFRYITKPIDRNTFYPIIDLALEEISVNKIIISVNNTTNTIPLKNIIYFEVYNHTITLLTNDAKYNYRGTLKELLAQLPSGRFSMPNQSTIVNLDYVNKATSDSIHQTCHRGSLYL